MQNKIIYFLVLLVLVGGAIFFWNKNNELGAPIVQPGVPVVEQDDLSNDSSGLVTTSYSMQDVATRNTPENCWTAINGSVYGLTEWIAKHPGGADAVIQLCGKDGSSLFNNQHGEFAKALEILVGLKIGVLVN